MIEIITLSSIVLFQVEKHGDDNISKMIIAIIFPLYFATLCIARYMIDQDLLQKAQDKNAKLRRAILAIVENLEELKKNHNSTKRVLFCKQCFSVCSFIPSFLDVSHF